MFWKPMVAASHWSAVPMSSGAYSPLALILSSRAKNSASVFGGVSPSASKIFLL